MILNDVYKNSRINFFLDSTVGPQSSDEESLAPVVAREKLRQLCSAVPLSIATSTVLALIVGATQARALPLVNVLSWLGLIMAANLLRLFLWHKDKKAVAANDSAAISLNRMRLGVALGGAAWGTASLLLYPANDPTHQMYLAFALAGLATGGIIAYTLDVGSALGYVILPSLPFAIRLLVEGDMIHLSMGVTVLLFLLFTIASIRRINHDLTDNITLRIQATEHEDQNQFLLKQLAETVDRFRSLTELSSDWYWEQDENFRFTKFAGQTAFDSSASNEKLLGKTRWEIGALNMSEADWQAHRADLQAHRTFHRLELHRINAEGQPFWSSMSGRPIFDETGNFRGYRGVGRIITKRKLAEAETQRLAFYDTLTGLPNRRYLLNRLANAVIASSRSQQLGALIFIDLDNFKNINDNHGHQLGDQLLQLVAQRLLDCMRDSDTVARLGGDEFVVIAENLGSTKLEAARLAEMQGEKLLTHLNKPYSLGNQRYTSTPSIGMTLIGTGHAETAEELMRRADTAMYQAKDAGRNTVRFFDPKVQAALNQRSVMELDLRRGIDEGQFILHYQPQVNGAKRMTGAEALIRWKHPVRGMVPPGEFITLAEETDLILPIGNWVLETACHQLVAWSRQDNTADLTLSVNVSARQLRHANFLEQVMAIIRSTGANPNRLKLEITESQLLDNVESTTAKMTHLKAQGIGFSLDDFGTGYSSLAYLKRLPLDQLKIDQSFVRDVLTDTNDATIARTILSLGSSLGLSVIAEGVETQEQLDFLAEHGCTAFQGYLFGRPSPIEALDQGLYLEKW